MTRDLLLAEFDELIRTMPTRADFGERLDDVLPWVGRAAAAIDQWDGTKAIGCLIAIQHLQSMAMMSTAKGFTQMATLLHEGRAALQYETGRNSMAIQKGEVFDYFDALRKIVQTARKEVFFVDGYLDADFVPRYLPFVGEGVVIRLLGGHTKKATLLPAVDLFAQQHARTVQLRLSANLHDRYLFVDCADCYQSGASFKDGARKAPTVLTKITDAFEAVRTTYEELWQAGEVMRD